MEDTGKNRMLTITVSESQISDRPCNWRMGRDRDVVCVNVSIGDSRNSRDGFRHVFIPEKDVSPVFDENGMRKRTATGKPVVQITLNPSYTYHAAWYRPEWSENGKMVPMNSGPAPKRIERDVRANELCRWWYQSFGDRGTEVTVENIKARDSRRMPVGGEDLIAASAGPSSVYGDLFSDDMDEPVF